eukprot:gene8375-10196_t
MAAVVDVYKDENDLVDDVVGVELDDEDEDDVVVDVIVEDEEKIAVDKYVFAGTFLITDTIRIDVVATGGDSNQVDAMLIFLTAATLPMPTPAQLVSDE